MNSQSQSFKARASIAKGPECSCLKAKMKETQQEKAAPAALHQMSLFSPFSIKLAKAAAPAAAGQIYEAEPQLWAVTLMRCANAALEARIFNFVISKLVKYLSAF